MKIKTFGATALAAILTSSIALAAAEWTYSDFDSDGNLELTEQEFTTGLSDNDVFSDWDSDGNSELSDDEFYDGVFSSWDEDDDGIVTENEFYTAGDGWFEDDEYSEFSAWDSDGDGEITDTEFEEATADSGLFEDWAGDDSVIGEDELYDGLYDTADLDDDDVIEEDEDGWFDWF